MSQLFPPGQEPFISQAKIAVNLFPDNQDILNLQRIINLGINRINQAAQYSQEGLNFFNMQDYENASIAFEKAIKANPLDYAHYENAATSNYLIGKLEKAQLQIDKVINDLNPLNGKCEYIKALIYIRGGNLVEACQLLAKASDYGYSQSKATLDQYCR